MTIRLAEPPSELRDTVRKALLRRAERGGFTTPALRRAKTDDLGLALPHPVYALSLQALSEGRGPAAAEQTGWRFLLQEGERTIGAVEVTLGGGEEAVDVNEGPFVRATADAVARIEELAEVGERDFELRLVKVLALYVVALWLHTGDEEADLVLPIGETPAELEAEQYSAADFAARLAEPARGQLEFDSSPPGRPARS